MKNGGCKNAENHAFLGPVRAPADLAIQSDAIMPKTGGVLMPKSDRGKESLYTDEIDKKAS